jgi:hypothetical protein
MPKYISAIYLSLDSTAITTINTDKTFDIKITMLNYYDHLTPTDSIKIIVSTTSTTDNHVLD